MILENSLNTPGFGYARVLIADYHQEYPLRSSSHAVVSCVWDPGEVSHLVEQIHGHDNEDLIRNFSDQMFSPLEQLYGMYYNTDMSLHVIQGTLNGITQVWEQHAQSLMGGPGGDDDTYDYWPNAFEMLIELTGDLIKLGHRHHEFLIDRVERVVVSAIAIKGAPEEWELPEIWNLVRSLKTIQASQVKPLVDTHDASHE